MTFALLVFFLHSPQGHAATRYNPECVRAAETIGSAQFKGHDASEAVDFIKAQKDLEAEVLTRGTKRQFDLRRNRVRVYVDAKNKILEAVCG